MLHNLTVLEENPLIRLCARRKNPCAQINPSIFNHNKLFLNSQSRKVVDAKNAEFPSKTKPQLRTIMEALHSSHPLAPYLLRGREGGFIFTFQGMSRKWFR